MITYNIIFYIIKAQVTLLTGNIYITLLHHIYYNYLYYIINYFILSYIGYPFQKYSTVPKTVYQFFFFFFIVRQTFFSI